LFNLGSYIQWIMHRVTAFAIVFSFCLFLSCSTTKKVSPLTSKPEEEKILFIAYEVLRDSLTGKISTNILYQRTVEGSIKPGSVENAPANEGNWTIRASNTKDLALETLVIENPLYQKREYVSSNGVLQMKELWLPRAELAIRMNYSKGMSNIEIAEITNNKNNRIIFSHAIEPNDQ
jgi:hypothetical protein